MSPLSTFDSFDSFTPLKALNREVTEGVEVFEGVEPTEVSHPLLPWRERERERRGGELIRTSSDSKRGSSAPSPVAHEPLTIEERDAAVEAIADLKRSVGL